MRLTAMEAAGKETFSHWTRVEAATDSPSLCASAMVFR